MALEKASTRSASVVDSCRSDGSDEMALNASEKSSGLMFENAIADGVSVAASSSSSDPSESLSGADVGAAEED